MPIERDNDAERQARIDSLMQQIRETQRRVERIAAEGLQRAEQIASQRKPAQLGGTPGERDTP